MQYFCLLAFLLLSQEVVWAQNDALSDQPEPAHWAFASIIGTGWYQLEGGRSAFIFTSTPRQTVRESALSDSGERQAGIFIDYDAALGLYSLDGIPDIVDSDNFSTVSFTPGIGFEIPVTPVWDLRANAHLGWGTAIGDGTSAWIYYSGLKSRYRFGGSQKNWSWLSGLFFAGINPKGGSAQSIRGFFNGLELSHTIPPPRNNSDAYRLHWQLGYTLIDDTVEVALRDTGYQSIGNTAEFGVAISRPENPFSLWFLEFDRLGLMYSVDSRGNFESLTFNFTSWFEQ